MPKSKWRPPRCKYCPASVENGDVISKRGLCSECGLARAAAAARALAEKEGGFHSRWAENGGGKGREPDARRVVGRFAPALRGNK